jgi:hypothetical protein
MQPFWIEAKKRWAIEIPKRMSPTGKAQRKLFATRDAAREFCSGRKEEHNEHGKASITAEERAVIVSVRDRLGDLSILPTVIDHWLATGVVLNPIGAKDAAKAFLDAVKADYGNKRTWHDVKWRIESFGEMAGARASSLLAFLDPTNTQYGRVNLSAIARESGFTKGALSRALLDLRDQTGISLNNGKLQSSRATYAQAQRASYANGDHSGQHRKDRNPARRPSREGKAAETALSDWLGSLAKSEALY